MKTEWALVTGASSGIGEAFARIFAENGISVVLAARDKVALQKVAESLQEQGVQTEIYASDLSQPKNAQGLYDFMRKKGISVQYLINNAGFGDYGFFLEGDTKKNQDMIALNIATLTYLTSVIGQDMKKAGSGYIVNLASIAAFFPGPKMAVYYATKAYVLSFSNAVGNELAGSGVSVTAVCPGPTKTGFSSAARAERTNIFAGSLPTAEQVARFGYAAMLAKKPVAVHGFRNKIVIALTRLLPMTLVTKLVRRAQG